MEYGLLEDLVEQKVSLSISKERKEREGF